MIKRHILKDDHSFLNLVSIDTMQFGVCWARITKSILLLKQKDNRILLGLTFPFMRYTKLHVRSVYTAQTSSRLKCDEHSSL